MPDSRGRFRGISVPALPWLDESRDDFRERLDRIVEEDRDVLDALADESEAADA